MTQQFFFADFLGLCNYCLCASPSAGPCLIILCSLALSNEDPPLLLCGTIAQPLLPYKWKRSGAWLSLNVSEQHLALLKPFAQVCFRFVSCVSCLLIPGCVALEKALLLF